MSFLNNTYTRIRFVQVIVATQYKSTDLESVLDSFNDDEDMQYNEEYFELLLEIYLQNKGKFLDLINENYNEPIDIVPLSILLAGLTSLEKKEDIKLVIKEYLKISDCFDVNSKFIHGILNQIYHKHYLGS